MLKVYQTLPAIYDAAITKDRWVNALDNIGKAVSARGVMLFAVNQTEIPFSLNWSNSNYAGLEAAIAEHMEKFGDIEIKALEQVLQAPCCEPLWDTDIWPESLSALRNREDFVSVRNFAGIFRKVAFNLSDNNFLNMGVAYQFDQSLEEPPAAFLDAAKFINPHLAKAIEVNRFYFQLMEKYNAVLSVLDRVQIGVCAISSGGEAVIVNDTAQQIFDQNDGIRIDREGRVLITDQDLNEQLKHHILNSTETARGQGDAVDGLMSIRRKSNRHPFVAEVSPLRDANGEYDRGFVGAIVTLIDPENPPDISVVPLVALYGLTNAESHVATHLVKGFTITKIAEVREVTPETIKTQIKSIYGKTGVDSRLQFIRKIVSMSPPII
ncbi:MAG: LuxR C-terminal-related transcriptional regulator [Pseudomonadota bacterium]